MRAHGAAKERLYRELMAGSIDQALVPGVREFLERYAGAPFGVATNAEPENVDFVLDTAGLRRYFQVVVDGQPGADAEARSGNLFTGSRASWECRRATASSSKTPCQAWRPPATRACGPWE